MRTTTRAATALAAGVAVVGLSALGAGAADFAGTPAATDTDPGTYLPEDEYPAFAALPGGGQALWDGGTLVFPADPDGSAADGVQVYRAVAAVLEAPRPVCEDGSFADDGTATVTVSVRVTNDGPGAGTWYDGHLRLYDGGQQLAGQNITGDAPAGHEETLSLSVEVSAADLAAGDIGIHLATETFHGSAKQWTADQFEAGYEFGVGEECADDDVSLVAPAVALGAGLLALGGYGLHRTRRQSA